MTVPCTIPQSLPPAVRKHTYAHSSEPRSYLPNDCLGAGSGCGPTTWISLFSPPIVTSRRSLLRLVCHRGAYRSIASRSVQFPPHVRSVFAGGYGWALASAFSGRTSLPLYRAFPLLQSFCLSIPLVLSGSALALSLRASALALALRASSGGRFI